MSNSTAADSAHIDPSVPAMAEAADDSSHAESTEDDSSTETVPDAFNEKAAAAWSSTGVGLSTGGGRNLDMFTQLVRGTSSYEAITKFKLAVKENPLLAFAILKHTRDCRGGKGEKEVVFHILRYVKEMYPKTYALVLEDFIKYGCYKDLLKLWSSKVELEVFKKALNADWEKYQAWKQVKDTDPEAKRPSVSMAHKWAPREGSKNKTFTTPSGEPKVVKKGKHYSLMARKLAVHMGLTFKGYRQRNSEMCEYIGVLETLLEQKRYDEINFDRLTSKNLALYGGPRKNTTLHTLNVFRRREELKDRFSAFIEEKSRNPDTMKSNHIEPHMIVERYIQGQKETDEFDQVAWDSIVKKLKKAGHFSKLTAVVDVSSSMRGVPMTVAIALGLLVASCSEGLFKNKLISFSERPRYCRVADGPLSEQVRSVKDMPWGGTTNFEAAMNLILDGYIQHDVKPGKEPIDTLIVFTDMQFDMASGGSTTRVLHDQLKASFAAAGYELPFIVYWNLRSTDTYPIRTDDVDTLLISGFSPELLKILMHPLKGLTPISLLCQTVEKYMQTELHPDEFPNGGIPEIEVADD